MGATNNAARRDLPPDRMPEWPAPGTSEKTTGQRSAPAGLWSVNRVYVDWTPTTANSPAPTTPSASVFTPEVAKTCAVATTSSRSMPRCEPLPPLAEGILARLFDVSNLEVMAPQGVPLPDTPAMAVHRGRLDLLQEHLRRNPAVLGRALAIDDIYPMALGCHEDRNLALHGAPLDGATLLHMAVEYQDLDVAQWLIEHGADVNARAAVDRSGFGGHTPIFNCV